MQPPTSTTTTTTTTTTTSTTTSSTTSNMRRTPDPKTAKRGRSEEADTPTTRLRTSSPEQEFRTPAWRDGQAYQLRQGETASLSDSYLGSLAKGGIIEESNWSQTMEEEELSSNMSAEGTDGTETIDDGTIN